MEKSSQQLIVIGGGAAGIFCAVNAARLNPSLKVLVLEKSHQLLSKVKVSGGGRCNLTHAHTEISQMIRYYPRGAQFLKKAFHHFFTTDTINWFESRGVSIKREEDGRMFPASNSSQSVIDALLKEANRYGVEIMLKATVQSIEKTTELFSITLLDNRVVTANKVCVAAGGFSKDNQFEWLRAIGHKIISPVPSLFTFNAPANPIIELMGLSVSNLRIKITGSKLVQDGPLLITHWGISGPAVLKLSAWGAREFAATNYNFKAIINFLHGDGFNENSLQTFFDNQRNNAASQKISTKNFTTLPSRLWQFLLKLSGVDAQMRYADFPKKIEQKLIKNLTAYELEVKGKTSFKEEFVTAGGVDLAEIDHQTMQSKLVPGLYFAGEIMDVDGVTGGFNFQHAWTSGYIAATSIAS